MVRKMETFSNKKAQNQLCWLTTHIRVENNKQPKLRPVASWGPHPITPKIEKKKQEMKKKKNTHTHNLPWNNSASDSEEHSKELTKSLAATRVGNSLWGVKRRKFRWNKQKKKPKSVKMDNVWRGVRRESGIALGEENEGNFNEEYWRKDTRSAYSCHQTSVYYYSFPTVQKKTV